MSQQNILHRVQIAHHYPRFFQGVQSLALLMAQFYVGAVFFKAGLSKLRDWDSTLMLFEYEYAVPLLPFELAAYLATFGELVLPILLFVGLFARMGALGLFIVNVVAVIALPDMPQAALDQHILWAILLTIIFSFGASKLSIDQFINTRLSK